MSKVSLVACAIARIAMRMARTAATMIFFGAGIFIVTVALLISGMFGTFFVYGLGSGFKHSNKALVGMVLATVSCWILAATTWIPLVVKGHSITGAGAHADWLFSVVTAGIMISMATSMALLCIVGIVAGACSAVVAFRESMDDCRARTRNLS